MKPLGSPERVRSGERKPVIDNVSDTARWVAEYRARESARRDRLFSDPYAAALAGERGRVIAGEARRGFGNGWFFIARIKLIDLLVEECVAEGCTRVINLAAGFDTRPYRLDLPSSLEWVEADLPGIIEEKERALAAEKPRCVLSRTAVDLTGAAARRAFLASATAGGGRTLVITEGLLLYLDASEVHALSADLKSCRVTWWTADVIGPLIRRLSARASRENNAPVVFAPDDGVAFLGTRRLDRGTRRHPVVRGGEMAPPFPADAARLPAPAGRSAATGERPLVRRRPAARPGFRGAFRTASGLTFRATSGLSRRPA
ncbi:MULTISPECIES: class I SAM-dependent methyltransferase [Streptomyces]|uniref:class I SAM-dependent methyltransferase n=1 Tax=Streptomyces TaxID=1883 RepID=UPI001C8D6AB7|nr:MULTISPECIES: SAM-dependent methyltransferase [Streptomyces]UBI39685.1 SAM-dependent methyltransferase [Streptomyces mobaraensis]UKW32265.1 SAM-dependent methyltransferase [Streptomyces sp. TYQ1024]